MSIRPECAQLVRVIPVAMAKTMGEVTVTVLSLEIFNDGFMVALQVKSHGAVVKGPRYDVSARDERGNTYKSFGMFGGASGARIRPHWSAHTLGPTLDPLGHTLTLTVAVTWPEVSGDDPYEYVFVIAI